MLRLFTFVLAALSTVPLAAQSSKIPEDFPRFTVPGFEYEMALLREFYWLHYPGAGPKATLWDEWLTAPSLWPAVNTNSQSDSFRAQWADTLSNRGIDEDGYVHTHQHASIAHQHGWPFPFWRQGGPNSWGWHFSLAGVPNGWHHTAVRDRTGWTLHRAEDLGINDAGWTIKLTEASAYVTAPPMNVDVLQAPFLQLRWKAKGLGSAKPWIEWSSNQARLFGGAQRMTFDAVDGDVVHYTMIPVYEHPEWWNPITGLQIQFGNMTPGAEITIQALFTQYDTRHNINNANFIRGCVNYFNWTGDVVFLRSQIERIRRAYDYVISEFKTEEEGVVLTPWIGHGGRTGIHYDDEGNKSLLHGYGVGNNYWDLLPFGHKDTYATIQFYDATRALAELERAVRDNPEWGIDALPESRIASMTGEKLRETGNEIFWKEDTGRFAAAVDIDVKRPDFGFTFLNLEAVYYDFATPEHARTIVEWVDGTRRVDGDTSQGEDIYHWRFSPRATTRRNIEYYGWFWSAPESIPWGGQVQDGGAVLGFSLHDLIARLRVNGPDDAWARLQEQLEWFAEVQEAGGYRAYYDGSRDGTLQGGGTAGGLGCDKEFFESVLVPQIMLEGFLGFRATPEGFALEPRLSKEWPSLTIDRIRYRGAVLSITASHSQVRIDVLESDGSTTAEITVRGEDVFKSSGALLPDSQLRFAY